MTGRATLRTALAVVAIGTAACGEGESSPRASKPALSVSQLVGQRFVFAFPGRTLPRGLARRIRAGEAAGIVIFSRNFRSRRGLRALIRRAQRLSAASRLDSPLLVMVDQEGGETNHVPGPPELSAESVGRTGDPRLARAEGRSAGRNLRALGINVNLAPVADVARPGSALQREERTYGQEPAAVAALADAFAAGIEDAGVVATLKHFPGFGAAATNTDYGPVRIPLSARTIRGVDEPPFRARDPRRRSHRDAEHGRLPGPRPPAGGALAHGRDGRAARPPGLRRSVDHGHAREPGAGQIWRAEASREARGCRRHRPAALRAHLPGRRAGRRGSRTSGLRRCDTASRPRGRGSPRARPAR